MRYSLLFIFILILVLIPVAVGQQRSVAFIDVSVVPMESAHVLSHQIVVVRDGRIAAIGSRDSIQVPADALRISGKGRYLMPGLADMHVHFIRPSGLNQFQMSASSDYVAENKILGLLYVANGVTTVRNMWGHQAILDLAKDIDAGNLIGPHIYSTGPINDGVPQIWQGSRAIETAAEAEEAARADKKAGYIALKVYDRLSADAYNSLVTAGKSQGLPIVGHVPSAVGLRGALAAHQYSVEHLTGYLAALQPNTVVPIPSSSQALLQAVDFTKLPELVQETKASGTWNCPTLVVKQSIPEDTQWQHRLALIPPALVERYRKGYPNWGTKPDIDRMAYQVNIAITKGLHEGGAKLLLGTDAYKPNALPGFSLHDELRNFVSAGLTPYEAIRAGTSDAALFLNQQNEFGTVTVGLRADLLLLEANPLENVANVTKRVGVMLRGTWFPEEDLQKRLSSLSSRSN